MYKSPRSFVGDAKFKGDQTQAGALFGGLFADFDNMGRPAATRAAPNATSSTVFSSMIKATVFKLHKEQSQKFLDFYKPILDEYRNRDIVNYFRTGEYEHCFSEYTQDGLPLADSEGNHITNKDKENYLREKSRVTTRWELEERRLSKDMSDVADLYNQTSVKVGLEGMLTAYSAKQGRTSLHELQKLELFKSRTSLEPRSMTFHLVGIKAGIRLGTNDDGKLYVRKVIHGGAAYDQGVMENDLIVSIDGVSFETKKKEDAKLAIKEALIHANEEHQPLVLNIIRNANGSVMLAKDKSFHFKLKIPKKDSLHSFLESDKWSVVIIFIVILDASLAPFRDSYPIINAIGIVITLIFLVEVSLRLYLWHYIKGEVHTFFLQSFDHGPAEGMELRERVQYLNILDCIVVFIDTVFLLVQVANQSAGGSLVSVVRLSRIGRVVRYFRIMKNLRSSRLSKVFKRNAHLIYHELLAWRYLLLLSALVVTDAVLMGLYGRGHFDDDESPTKEALGFGIFVSIFCFLEYALRIACHMAVIGEIKSFFMDILNFFDSIVEFVDFILFCTLLSSGARDNGMAIKVFKVFRFFKSLKIISRCRKRIQFLIRKSPLFKKIMNILFPPRLTAQQKEDLEIYGEYFPDKDEEDVEIGADIVKLGSVEYDEDELEGAWEVVKYDPLTHGELIQSRASKQGLVSESMAKNMNAHTQLSEGDEFMFNKLTGATKWDTKQLDKLMTKQEIKAQQRLIENERIVAVRELQHMGREEYASQILRQLSVLEDKQLNAVFGQRLPFKHAGRYEVVHRGYSAPGDGYGRRKQDCFLGQGQHSRTFCCRDTLGEFSNIVVKVSRKTEASLFAQRGEAGTLKSLERFDDDIRRKYFLTMVDSFDFGASENRFAMVFEQLGPSLGYLLSMYSRPPSEDPLFGKSGLNEMDAEYLSSVAPWVSEDREQDKKLGTGYLSEPPRLKRRGPVPRCPLPIGFTVDVIRQVCEAVTFLHEQAGMVHGDITPDNIVLVQTHDKSVIKQSFKPDETTPYVPGSSQIKLVDLNAACFIPIAMGAKSRGYEDYEDEEENPLDATASPLINSSLYLKKKADKRDVIPETTISYRAPELDVYHSDWNAGVDVWSIGCLLVEMYSGKADYQAALLAAEHAAPDTDSGLAVRAAAVPSLRDMGRSPLFRPETSFEHLAMVERCIGTLPKCIYDRWSNIESPAMVGPYARARVASVPPLVEALEANRTSLLRDQEARVALTKHRMGELENEEVTDFIGSVFGGFNKDNEDDKFRLLIREINLEAKTTAIEPWRKDAMADLLSKVLEPDLEKRISIRQLVEHQALQTGIFAGFGSGLFK